MTEQSKIPVPPQALAASLDESNSLIERAVKAYDLRRLAPAPVPRDLAPPVIKPAMRAQGSAVEPAAVALTVPPPPPPVQTPVMLTPALPQVRPAEFARSVVPVVFGGERHAVDRSLLRSSGLIVPDGAVTGLMEEFRIIKRHVLAVASEMRRERSGMEAQRVLICSPHPGEGKSYCAMNLALAIAAEKESEVLLVDADFAKPSVLKMLGLEDGPGLMDALADPAVDVAACVLGTDIPGLWVLPAGHATNSDSEFLSSSRTRAVLDRLTQGAPQRIVIFDSPPALAASPAAELAKYVGQALVVARADKTGQSALEDAVALLAGCSNIQLLLNAVHFSPSGRRFGSYYGYGE